MYLLVTTLEFTWMVVSSRNLFFSFYSLSHLNKILESPEIRCWRLEAGNSWRKWNESVLHLYSSVEQVRFGINLNSNEAYHSCSSLYFQNSFQTLVSLSEHHFGGLSKHSQFTPVDIWRTNQFTWVIVYYQIKDIQIWLAWSGLLCGFYLLIFIFLSYLTLDWITYSVNFNNPIYKWGDLKERRAD